MRKETLASEVRKYVDFSDDITIRDERAINKMLSAFMKLLFPNMEFDRSELEVVVKLTLELRQKVREWLHKLSPGEFSKKPITYAIKV